MIKKLLVAESDRGKLEELVSIQRTVAVGGVNYVEIHRTERYAL